MSERDPVERCRYCGYLYYVWKLPFHESICSANLSEPEWLAARTF